MVHAPSPFLKSVSMFFFSLVRQKFSSFTNFKSPKFEQRVRTYDHSVHSNYVACFLFSTTIVTKSIDAGGFLSRRHALVKNYVYQVEDERVLSERHFYHLLTIDHQNERRRSAAFRSF
jgi:hypothetical protein